MDGPKSCRSKVSLKRVQFGFILNWDTLFNKRLYLANVEKKVEFLGSCLQTVIGFRDVCGLALPGLPLYCWSPRGVYLLPVSRLILLS